MLDLREIMVFCILLLCTVFPTRTSCGPATGARDRFDDNAAIAESWQRQTLLNIVNNRSGGAPIFLDVASIIHQNQPQTDINAALGWTFPPGANNHRNSIAGSSIDRSTTSCKPLTGEKPARNLMPAVSPGTVMRRVDFFLASSVHQPLFARSCPIGC